MDTARPALADVWAARVVAWHNRHPLAQRITPAQVQAMGWVDLPFAAPRTGMADRERWVPVFSEPFLPALKNQAIARWALRHGREVPPQDHDAPVRRVAIDRKLLPEGEHAMVLWLPTAAVHAAGGQQRVLLGGVAPFPVLGKRLYSVQRSAVAAAVAVLAGTGLASAGQWWAQNASPQALMAAAAAASGASGASGAPALAAAASASAAHAAASAASGALAAKAASATLVAQAPAAAVAAASAAASAAVAASAPAAVAPAPAPPALAASQAPPAHAQAAPSASSPSAVAMAPAGPSAAASAAGPLPQAPDDRPEGAGVGTRRAAAPFPPRRPLLDEASKLEAQREVAAARAARAAAKGLPVYAVVTRRVNKRSDADIDSQLLAGALANVDLPRGLRVEPLPAGSGWQAICWPFLERTDAERLREHLASRGVKLEVVAF